MGDRLKLNILVENTENEPPKPTLFELHGDQGAIGVLTYEQVADALARFDELKIARMGAIQKRKGNVSV